MTPPGADIFKNPAQPCWLGGLPVGPACTEPFESCEQKTIGAFGPNGHDVKTITVAGTPAGSLLSGESFATLVSLFAVPPTLSASPVDDALDLPGPAAVALPGSANLCTSAVSCP